MCVNATLSFLADDDLYLTERPYSLKFEAPVGLRRSNILVEKHQQTIQDVRCLNKSLTLDENGFVLVRLDTEMAYEDFEEEDSVRSIYLVEVAEMLQKLVGASRVQVFEYVVRSINTCHSTSWTNNSRFANKMLIFRSRLESHTNTINRPQWFILVRAS